MREDETRSRKFAKQLRRRMTDAEVILWSRLRRKPVGGIQFRRQHPIGPYIVDFACAPAKLAIEIDGATHGSEAEIAYDRRRDAYLRAQGWRVVRFNNTDIYENLYGVVEAIYRELPTS